MDDDQLYFRKRTFFSFLLEPYEVFALSKILNSLLCKRTRMMEEHKTNRIPVIQAMEILRNGGLEVTEKQVNLILDFLEKFANIAIDQYVRGVVVNDTQRQDNVKYKSKLRDNENG